MKLTTKELDKIKKQMTQPHRGETWVGIRPVVFGSKKYNKKQSRAEGKRLCREGV